VIINTGLVRTRGALLLGVALSVIWGLSASAQTSEIETVTVTAEKQATDLQKTPATINVYSGAQLAAEGVTSTQDLQLHTPSLMMSSNTVQGEAYIRGIGTDIASIGADPSVAFLLDGVYLPRLSTAMQDLYDVDRVEILEGPQGTLYGRNATGGVVNIISQLPTSDFTYKADAIYGNYNEQVYRASVSGPLDGSDDLTGRFTFARQSHDGYVENLTTGGSIDSVNDWASRGILRYQPSSKLDIVLSADLSWDGGSPATAVQVLSNDSPAVLFFGGIVPNNPYKTT
jgi:iron complex outermembrane receptor protein